MRAARKNLVPNRDRVLFYSDGKEVIPGVQAMHTPGHTVGHTCFVITSGSDTLYFAGDLAHHNIIIETPRMEDVFDTDPATRHPDPPQDHGHVSDAAHAYARLSPAVARPRLLRRAR